MLLDPPEDFILRRVLGFLQKKPAPGFFGVGDEFLSGGTVSAEVLLNFFTHRLGILRVVTKSVEG
jgi:hypothetical protein